MAEQHLTPEAKAALRTTIRRLRGEVSQAIHQHVEGLYRLGVVDASAANLDEAAAARRTRLDAWLAEQLRTETEPKTRAEEWKRQVRDRYRLEAELEAAHTLVNRLVVVRHMEAMGLLKPAVLTGGWSSKAYTEFRFFAPELCQDDTEGYRALLQVVFDELALDLPGLFGDVGLTALLPVPAATLRNVVEALNQPSLETAWTDDTTLGWVYQYWNDPRREELDRKIADGGKIEPHEIASKTQMFTERYMVEWLLHNSLGQAWLAICRKNHWTADVEHKGADGLSTLERLEARRKDWRGKRERAPEDPQRVALDALMPIETELEDRWKYWVPQPMPDDAPGYAPASIREFKMLDPACGSGHFLVIAFGLLVAMYREEAQNRREQWSDRQIAEWILENNLHGLDIDPRAVQIAAAALYLKAKQTARDAQPAALNLVASNLQIADLPDDDPAVLELEAEVDREAKLPRTVVQQLLKALHGADYLGSLLKVDTAIDSALDGAEYSLAAWNSKTSTAAEQKSVDPARRAAQKQSVQEALERFLAQHGGGSDLGLRLHGEQLATGVRFVRMVKEGSYDLVVANPPYQGTSKMSDGTYVATHYPRGKADLYAAFLERGLQLCKTGGTSSMLTMRGWMFLSQFEDLRKSILHAADLRTIGDADRGAFEDIPDEVVAVVMAVVRNTLPSPQKALATQPTPLDDRCRDNRRTARKRAALLCGVGRFDFNVTAFRVIEGEPLVYWWTSAELAEFARTQKLSELASISKGLCSGDDTRFLRHSWEVARGRLFANRELGGAGDGGARSWETLPWKPYIKGAEGRMWCEPLSDAISWNHGGMEIRLKNENAAGGRIVGSEYYGRLGVAFSSVGSEFYARAHRFPSVFGDRGPSVFGLPQSRCVTLMNRTLPRKVMHDLNPTISFQVADVSRLPVFPVVDDEVIYATLDRAFTEHEAHREASVEFRQPGPSPWRHAQAWAQLAVDRPQGEPLPPYQPDLDPPQAIDFVSFAIGVALGRFGLDGQGILDADGVPCGIQPPGSTEPPPDPSVVRNARLAHGILYLSGAGRADGLAHPACAPLIGAWKTHGPSIAASTDLNLWLRKKFFADDHRQRYDNRPIYLPLSSKDRTFVAFCSIHRWRDDTLQVLLADHLLPEKRALDGQLADLAEGRASTDKARREAAAKDYERVAKQREELDDFIAKVQLIAEQGTPQPDPQTPPRAKDAAFRMDLDDGVMVNAAALWPLLEPQQWKDPRKWWKELAKGEYLWSHLAARYWPEQVEAKCKEEPSHAVAHGCFWRLHPARAFAWELRLQQEIGPDFRLDEQDSDALRSAFQRNQTAAALAAVEKEAERRLRNLRKDDKTAELLELALPAGELWQVAPEQVLALEVKLRKKCGARFRITEAGHEARRPASGRASGEERQGGLNL